MTRMPSPAALTALIVALISGMLLSPGTALAQQACTMESECSADRVCHEGMCHQVCAVDTDCDDAGYTCQDAHCQPADGEGHSHDSGSGHHSGCSVAGSAPGGLGFGLLTMSALLAVWLARRRRA